MKDPLKLFKRLGIKYYDIMDFFKEPFTYKPYYNSNILKYYKKKILVYK